MRSLDEVDMSPGCVQLDGDKMGEKSYVLFWYREVQQTERVKIGKRPNLGIPIM